MAENRDSNWGRWGPDDEYGAMNHLTPDVVLRAVGQVTTGDVISLGQSLGPDTIVPSERKKVERYMTRDGGDYPCGMPRRGRFQFAEDVVSFASHSGTHIDALSHVWYDDELYNGFDSSTIRSTTGARHCGAEKLRPIVTRGLLFDIVETVGRPLEAGEVVSKEMLESMTLRQGLQPETGDAILLRTGWFEANSHDPERYLSGEPGLDEEAASWLAMADVCLVGADNFAIEVMPFMGDLQFPVHQSLIRDYGIPLLEGCVLKELAMRGSTEFLFVANPVSVVGSTAGMVQPLAIL